MSTKKRQSVALPPLPRKCARRVSGYNLFHRDFLKSEDGKAVSTLSEKNRISAEKWKETDDSVKASYNEKSKTHQPKVLGKRRELNHVLSQLSDVSSRLKEMGCEMFYTVVTGSDHYCGGTDKGCDFVEKDAPWIPYSFIGAVHPKPNIPTQSTIDACKDNERQEVQKLFNNLYAFHVKKPGVKLPYSKIKEMGISLEGIEIKLKHPSSYGAATLKSILAKKDTIRLKVENLSIENQEESCSSNIQCKKVFLMSEHHQTVGMGYLTPCSDTADSGIVTVTVDYIQPDTGHPAYDETIEIGEQTTWPAGLIRYA